MLSEDQCWPALFNRIQCKASLDSASSCRGTAAELCVVGQLTAAVLSRCVSSLCRSSVFVFCPGWGLSGWTGSGSVSWTHPSRHQRHLLTLLQLVLQSGKHWLWVDAAVQPGHRGHRGQGQSGGHLPLVAGGHDDKHLSAARCAVVLKVDLCLVGWWSQCS